MHPLDKGVIALALSIGCFAMGWVPLPVAADASPSAAARETQRIDLAERLAAGKLRTVNRTVTTVTGAPGGVHLSEKPDVGLAWIEGSDFDEGTIEIDIRGRDVPQASFVGVAFHRKDDATYESVYLRPFNFRAADSTRHAHAVQYIAHPTYTWQKLRDERPGVYEKAVSPAPDPNGWFHARVVVADSQVSVWVGDATAPSLVVTELSHRGHGMVGLWVGNGSGGDFANLRIVPK